MSDWPLIWGQGVLHPKRWRRPKNCWHCPKNPGLRMVFCNHKDAWFSPFLWAGERRATATTTVPICLPLYRAQFFIFYCLSAPQTTVNLHAHTHTHLEAKLSRGPRTKNSSQFFSQNSFCWTAKLFTNLFTVNKLKKASGVGRCKITRRYKEIQCCTD